MTINTLNDSNLVVSMLSGTGQTIAYAHEGDAGMDLRSSATEPIVIRPGERAVVPTGLFLAIPDRHVGLIHSRSGLAAKNGVIVLNAPGVIDSKYRGEIQVILLNTDRSTDFVVEEGDRIAQIIFQRYETAEIEEVHSLTDTVRGSGGLGSTGV